MNDICIVINYSLGSKTHLEPLKNEKQANTYGDVFNIINNVA